MAQLAECLPSMDSPELDAQHHINWELQACTCNPSSGRWREENSRFSLLLSKFQASFPVCLGLAWTV